MKKKHEIKEKISKKIDVPVRTLYNWEKNRPKLFNYLIECESKKKSIIEELFEQLDDIEKEMYIAEIKAKILRKKVENKS